MKVVPGCVPEFPAWISHS